MLSAYLLLQQVSTKFDHERFIGDRRTCLGNTRHDMLELIFFSIKILTVLEQQIDRVK